MAAKRLSVVVTRRFVRARAFGLQVAFSQAQTPPHKQVARRSDRRKRVDMDAVRRRDCRGSALCLVHGNEINPRLRDQPNVVALPHMGSATVEGRVEMGEKVLINIQTFADGNCPPDQIVPGMV